MRALLWILGLLTLALLPVAGRGDQATPVEKSKEAPALQKQIEALLTGWVTRDPAAMQKVWSPKSEQWEPFLATQKRFWEHRDRIDVDGLRFRGTVADGKALLRVMTQVTWQSELTREKQTDPVVWTVYWEKEGDDWRIHEWEDASVSLWIAFNRAPTPEAREELWKKDPEVANIWVVRQFGYAAEALAGRGDWEPALRANSLQRQAARLLGDGKSFAAAVATGATLSYTRADFLQALKDWEEAEKAYRAAGDPIGAARMRMNQAVALEATGQYQRALQLSEEGGAVLNQTGQPERQAESALNRGVLLFRLARYDEALEDLQTCVTICRKLGWVWGAAKALLTIASIWDAGGAYETAQAINEECLKVARELKQPREELAALNNLTIVLRERGEHRRSIALGEEGRRLAQQYHDAAMEADLATNLAATYQEMGRFADAIVLLDGALAAFSRQGATPGMVSSLVSLAVLYDLTERRDDMFRTYQRALELSRKVGDRRNEAAVQLGLANYYRLQGDSKKGNEALLGAAEAASAVGDLDANMTVTTAVAFALMQGKHADLARKEAERVLLAARRSGSKSHEGVALYILGRSELQAASFSDAATHLRQAAELCAGAGKRLYEMHARWHLGMALEGQKQTKEALAEFEKGAGLLESIREDTREQSLQTSFFAQWTGYYHTLIEAYLHAGMPQQALATAERAKGRGLVDLLRRGKVTLAKSLPEAERKEEQRLEVQVTSYSAELESAQALTTDQRLKLQDDLQRARSDYEEYRRRLFLRRQGLRVQRGEFAPVSLQDLGRKIFARDPGATVFSYVSGLEQTWLFVLRAGAKPGAPAQVSALSVPVKVEELQDQIEQFRAACAQPGGAYKPVAQKLYSELIAPAEKLLAGKTHVVIVPDSAMPPLPFQALVDGPGRHLVERFGISYAPSVTALTAMADLKDGRAKGEKPASPLVAVGRPQFTNEADLPATEAEVKRIAGLAGPKAKVLLGKDATEERVRAEIANARFVHLATHGKLNEAAPMYSGLALTKGPNDDGVLEARELMDLDLTAEMVVLSACETGLGKQVRGEGVLGLTWALFVAGTPTSVVSQWQVEDTSTGALMGGFYKALLQPAKGAAVPTKAEALRRAQLALMRDGKHGHPYYWAPFVLVGDWR